ncbi:uncharacterized protein G2W53_043486 [Senna tora]|uniref:Uncharacterized protein n=1 Tax=Senna tora TaxID=362788 RepID=A0A834SL97_9FABA|nr:uncharacterized protein G2W53_043486 [Senna tora]
MDSCHVDQDLNRCASDEHAPILTPPGLMACVNTEQNANWDLTSPFHQLQYNMMGPTLTLTIRTKSEVTHSKNT